MDQSPQLSNDEIFEVLSNRRRRQILVLLHQQSGTAELSDLAEEIANSESDGTPTTEQYKRVYISLYQTHVPKLEDLSIVTYDSDTKRIELTDQFDVVFSVFRGPTDRHPWWKYYAIIALVSVVVVSSYWLLFPTDRILGTIVALAPLVVLLLIVGFHYHSTTQTERIPIERLVK